MQPKPSLSRRCHPVASLLAAALVAGTLVAGACSSPSSAPADTSATETATPSVPESIIKAGDTIDAAGIVDTIQALSDDVLAGRGPGSDGDRG
ncbi:MAG: hypothetical protein KDD11_07700, partial [Acidobacteria bacterium]|nr:hypothetical protein [Acidobacteriota bacterium]